MNFVQVAVDGPAGSGKTSIMKEVAKRLNFNFIDTGLMYRAFTKFLLKNHINFSDITSINNALEEFDVTFQGEAIYVNNENYMDFVNDKDVLENINKITVIPEVRDFMVKRQRKVAENNNCVLTGRDITSIVLPKATVKIYLDCSVETRAKRRLAQNVQNGADLQDYDIIYKMILQRDESDQNRVVGPLVIVKDAVVVDNSHQTFEQCVEEIINIIKEKI